MGWAVVTGGTGAIGLAIVSALAEQGVSIAVWDRPGADFGAASQVCAGSGVGFVDVEVDVADERQVEAAVTRTREAGRIRYGVNVAGVDGFAPAESMPAGEWRRVLDINLSGLFFSCQAEFALMGGSGGAIVNIASMSAQVINKGVTHIHYSASKAGVVHLSRDLAVEWVGSGIRVNSVSPGYTRTPMTDLNAPEVNAQFCRQIPMGWIAEVGEIAGPVVFLLSDLAAYITGHDLVVDGGFTAW